MYGEALQGHAMTGLESMKFDDRIYHITAKNEGNISGMMWRVGSVPPPVEVIGEYLFKDEKRGITYFERHTSSGKIFDWPDPTSRIISFLEKDILSIRQIAREDLLLYVNFPIKLEGFDRLLKESRS